MKHGTILPLNPLTLKNKWNVLQYPTLVLPFSDQRPPTFIIKTAQTSIPRFLDSSYLKGLDFNSRKAPRHPTPGIAIANEPNRVYSSHTMLEHGNRTASTPFLARYDSATRLKCVFQIRL